MMQVLTSEIELPVELKMPAPSSASPAWWTSNVVHWLGILFCLLTLLAYSDYLLSYRVSYIQEVDSQGYYLMAKSFSHFHNPRWPDDIAKFRGHVFIDVGNGEVMTKYSPGWPLLMVPFYWIGGHSAVMWCNTIFGVIAAIAIFLIGLELFNSMAAFICLFLWAFSPMTPAYNAYPLAHCSEVMMTALAILFAIRWGKTGRLCFAGLMGFCMGFMPLIRATTILIWPAIIVAYFVFAHRRRKELAASGSVITAVPAEAGFIRTIASWPARMVKLDWLRMFWRRESLSFWIFLVTFAIPTVFLAIFNWHNFGRPWWAGYHFSGEQDAFTFTFRVLRERFFGEYGSREFLLDDLVWTIGLLGMWLRIGKPGIAWVLALWCIPTFVLYSGYYFHPDGPVYWRFVLPTIPALIFGVALAADAIVTIFGTAAWWLRKQSAEMVWVIGILLAPVCFAVYPKIELFKSWFEGCQWLGWLLFSCLPLILLAMGMRVGAAGGVPPPLGFKDLAMLLLGRRGRRRPELVDRRDPALQFPVARLMVALLFALWIYQSPLRFFVREKQYNRVYAAGGEAAVRAANLNPGDPGYGFTYANGGDGAVYQQMSYEERSDAPVLLLSMPKHNPTRRLAEYVTPRPTSVYSTSFPMWDASTFPNVEAYDVLAWSDSDRFFSPWSPNRGRVNSSGVMQDLKRQERMHKLYGEMGHAGIRKNFVEHIEADFAAGKDVLFIVSPQDESLSWLKNAGFNAALIHKAESPADSPAYIYRVSPK